MSLSPQSGHDRFRILLYRGDGSQLLLERNAQGFALPQVCIPPCARVAQQINEAISKDWRLQSLCLFPVGDQNSPAYAVELCGAVSVPPANMKWFPVNLLAQRDFPEAQDFYAIDTAIRLFDQYRNVAAAEPFGKFGWLRDVTEWLESKATQIGLRMTGTFQQFNASPTFSLIRFETNGPAIWFKAVGEPNLREYSITLALAKYFPAFVPCVIAMRNDWNGWLAIEAEGTHPNENSDMEVWTRIAKTLAEMQIASFGQALHLVNIGCRDTRVGTLVELVEPFVEAMTELMERQTKESPPTLSRSELLTLQTQLQDILSEAANSEIPNAVGHLDFNPGNIVANDNGCVFLDWAEACAGHPFLTFQYLLQHLRRYRQPDKSWESAITCMYLNTWRSSISPKKITDALRVSPLLAVFAYATCRAAWSDPVHRARPEVAGYFRSLTRRMKREADLLVSAKTTRDVPCLS
jgi:Phosphotransferase enzyme family